MVTFDLKYLRSQIEIDLSLAVEEISIVNEMSGNSHVLNSFMGQCLRFYNKIPVDGIFFTKGYLLYYFRVLG